MSPPLNEHTNSNDDQHAGAALGSGSRALVSTDRSAGVWVHSVFEVLLLVALFFIYAGNAPPMVNESHYLVLAKNYWQPDWCASDLLVSSAKPHATFYFVFGWLTKFMSLEATAWVGRLFGWSLLAIGLRQLSWSLFSRHYLSLVIATVWMAGIEWGNLAGEWVIGGIEAKVPAYGFVLMGLAQMVHRRWNRVWPLLGIGAAFHVLTGGWSVVAASIAWWVTERPRDDRQRFFSWSLIIGGLIALLGLLPAIALSAHANVGESTLAARIYTYYRIKHHLLPSSFQPTWYLRHGLLIALTLWAGLRYRREPGLDRLGGFTMGAVIIGLLGLLLGVLPMLHPDLAARLLRYYWFRLTDAAVPLMLGACLARMFFDQSIFRVRSATVLVLAAALLVAESSYRTGRLKIPPTVSNDLLGFDVGASPVQQQQVYQDWLAVCRWAKASSEPSEVFLTPRHQQTFKWYAERGEVVNWKDVPQDTESLLEWHRRFQEIFPQRLGFTRVTIQYSKLREYRQRYGVRWMIVDRRIVGDRLPLVRRYPLNGESNATYAVYELPELYP